MGAVPSTGEQRKHGLLPVRRDDARLLVLGSLPGEASLAAACYYAHPRNHFWRLMAQVTGEGLDTLEYEQRLERLVERRVALWDVIHAARRSGSLDSAISAAVDPYEWAITVTCGGASGRIPRMPWMAASRRTAPSSARASDPMPVRSGVR